MTRVETTEEIALRIEVAAWRERAENAEATLKALELHWECQQRIDALEAARDEACDMLIAIDRQDNIGANRIIRVHELRKVGSP
jgi:hypothetical protein